MEHIFSFEEFIKYLHIGRTKGYELLKSGKIKGKKVGKKWIICKSEVDKFLK